MAMILILALTAGTLAGCGLLHGKKGATSLAKVDMDTIYAQIESPLSKIKQSAETGSEETGSEEEAADDMGEERFNFISTQAANGKYYVLYSDLESVNNTFICVFDEKGEKGQTIPLPGSEEGGITNFTVMSDGSLILLGSQYDGEKEAFAWQMGRYTVEEGEKPGLKEIWKQTVSEQEDFYPAGMAAAEEEIFMMTEAELRIYDGKEGTEKLKTDLPKDFYGNICKTPDGRILLVGGGMVNNITYAVDPASGKYQEIKYNIPITFFADTIASGTGQYDFYASASDGVYGLTQNAPEPVKVFDFLASDLEVESVTAFSFLSAETAVLLYFNSDYGSTAELFKKTGGKGQGDKVALSLACTYADQNLSKAVVRFNKTNKKYRIVLKEFSFDDEGNNTLNMEIAAGNIPDMLCISQDMPVESYAAKGMFEDLEPMFLKDEEVAAHNYLDNVIDSYRIDGKMYFVVPAFNVIGLIGKKKDFGDTVGVTTSQIEKMIKKRKLSYETALGPTSRDSMLSWVMFCAMDEYVDWDRGTCSFGSESFINLLKFCAKFPRKINYENIDWVKMEAAMREGKQLARDGYMFNFDSYMRERYGYIGEDISFMGYPGKGENGPVIMYDLAIAITNNSDYPEGCWEFLREFYLDDFQQSIDSSFPVSEEAIMMLADKAMNPKIFTYIDENGKEVSEPETGSVSINEKMVKLPVPSQEDIDAVMDILRDLKTKISVDSKITGIIDEEAGAYFAGQKSAEETADIIQSRVKVYISETK